MEEQALTILNLYNERQILSLIQLGAILDLPPEGLQERVDWLYCHGYLCIEPRFAQVNGTSNVKNLNGLSFNTPLQITIDGQAALQARQRMDKQQKRDNIRYAITTAIAVLALVLAAISLAAQLGLIQLPVTSLPR